MSKTTRIKSVFIASGSDKYFPSAKKKSEEFLNAIKSNDIKKARTIILNGFKLKDESEASSIAIKWLIEKERFVINAKDNFKRLSFILNNGADPNLLNENPFFLSEIIKKNSNKYQSLETLELLIKHHFDINSKCGINALFSCIDNDCNEIAKLLVNNFAKLDISADGDSYLTKSIKKKNLEITKYLIDHGADVNYTPSAEEITPLMAAAGKLNVKIITALIDYGAEINIKDKMGLTALMYAVQAKNLAIVKELLNRSADIDAQDNKSETALIKAIKYKHLNIAKELLFQGANIDIENNEGETAISIAEELGGLDIFNMDNTLSKMDIKPTEPEEAIIHQAKVDTEDKERIVNANNTKTIEINCEPSEKLTEELINESNVIEKQRVKEYLFFQLKLQLEDIIQNPISNPKYNFNDLPTELKDDNGFLITQLENLKNKSTILEEIESECTFYEKIPILHLTRFTSNLEYYISEYIENNELAVLGEV